MLKNFVAILLFTVAVVTASHAQTHEVDALVKEGIRLYDAGDYQAAVEQYQKALAIDSNSASANYEIAYTYFALNNYQQTVVYADKVIKQHTINGEASFIIKGSALDLMGNSAEAINTYKTGQLVYPGSHLLYYNLALTLYNTSGDKKEIEQNLQLALKIKPSHASSHFLLAILMVNQNKRVQALLSLYNFLLLEPKGNRAEKALQILNGQLAKGVSKKDDKTINITMFVDKDKDEFSSAEVMLSLLEASKTIDANKGKTDNELFIENTGTFFSVLGELKKDNKSFWWTFYTDFFHEMKHKNMVEALCYCISQSKNDSTITDWLTKNDNKVKELLDWSSAYERR